MEFACRAYFQGALSFAILLLVNGELNRTLLPFGKGRWPLSRPDTQTDIKTKPKTQQQQWLYQLSVPKAYFKHFYVVAVCSSALLCWDILYPALYTHNVFDSWILSPYATKMDDPIKAKIALVCVVLMTIQTWRRFYESWFIAKPSPATMHVVHYLLGITYYVPTSLAMVVDSVPYVTAFISQWDRSNVALSLVSFVGGDMLALASVVVFFIASMEQHAAHVHLASLRTTQKQVYTLPTQRWFRLVACPHYLFEVVLYVSLATLTHFQSTTINWLVVFVTVELSIAADMQYRWYRTSFPKETTHLKRIFPFVF